MRGGLTSCSQSARSEPRKGAWWREPLVWAAADTFDLVPGAALPLNGPSQETAQVRQIQVSREEGFLPLCGSLAKHRPEYAIPQRCADAIVSRRELMMTSVVLKQ